MVYLIVFMENIHRTRLQDTMRATLFKLRTDRWIYLALYQKEKDVNLKGLYRARLEQNQLSTWHYERALYGSIQTDKEAWKL